MKILLILIILVQTSCTHWLIDTETRIQVENGTNREICEFSLVSQKGGKRIILVPDTLKKGERSKVYENEWVGEFEFEVRFGDSFVPLGIHKLKGGSVLALIKEKDNEIILTFNP